MRKRKGSRPTPSLDTLSSFMPGLQGDRKRLTEIQSAYDNLTLLGQLLCAGTDITGMRQDFNQLAVVLLEQLASEHYKKAALNLGGIAIVFDTTPQFEAMLHDALPRQADGQPVPGALAVFADRNGRVIASTSSELPPGQPLMIGYEFFNLPAGESCANVIIFNGCYYAVGSTMSDGYREYKAAGASGRQDVVALAFSPLSDRIIDADSLPSRREAALDSPVQHHLPAGDSIEIACFHIGRSWYGIRSSDVIEAVNADRLTPMPGSSDLIHGCLIYNGQAISIVDLSTALAGRQTGRERRATVNTGKRQIVILHSARHQAYFGILVDQLGTVAEVPAAHIEPLPDMMSEGNSLIESLVKPQADDERRILIVLSAERILNRVCGETMVKKAPWLPMLQGSSD